MDNNKIEELKNKIDETMFGFAEAYEDFAAIGGDPSELSVILTNLAEVRGLIYELESEGK